MEGPIEIFTTSNRPREYALAMQILTNNLPTEEMRRTARYLLNNPNNPKRTWALSCGSEIIGASVCDKITAKRAYLEFLLLLPDYRKAGLGRRFLSEIEDNQRSRGVKEIEADTSEDITTKWMIHHGYKVVEVVDGSYNHLKTLYS